MENDALQVSIVIVCMNNLKNLYPCLESIRKYTSVSYETIVVAYLFSKDNLEKVKSDFPWATFIESNEIRGFSENNNLALRLAKGKYCFVLNDDTEMRMDVVGQLVSSIEKLPSDVAIISPVLVDANNTIRVCGRDKSSFGTFLLSCFHIRRKEESAYVNGEGIFRTYNIIGAAFLIKTKIFKDFGWFDERYFFCPEDIALSTLLNNKGYSCYVDSNVRIIHYEGMSGKSMSLVQTATIPAACRGKIIFYSDGKFIIELVLRVVLFVICFSRSVYHFILGIMMSKPNAYQVLAVGDFNSLYACVTNKTPKEIFKKFYMRIHTIQLRNQ